MKHFALLTAAVLLSLSNLLAQRTVTGTVTAASGDPLIGASVVVKGTTSGTVTDIDGQYSIVVQDEQNTLLFSYTGYATKEVELGASNILDVTMEEGVILEAAVVTALGIRRDEKALGYAVQEVGGEEINSANTVGALEALAGKAAGVQITTASGSAGGSTRIVLRGQTSFNGNNEALIVVDGIRVDNQENSTERTLNGVAYSNRAMDINPNDIESVTVLKGAAATALYGVEGARGVVLITTKKGAKGQRSKITYNTTFTVSEVNRLPELQNQYVQGIGGTWLGPETGFLASWGPNRDTLFWDGADYQYDRNGRIVGQSDPNAQTPFSPYDNFEDAYQRGIRWNNNLAMTGGNEMASYRLSIGHSTEEGIVPKNTFERFNVGISGSADFLDGKLKATTSINYVKTNGRRIQQGSNTSGYNLGLFRTPISFDNSNGFDNPEDEVASYTFADGSQRNYRGGGGYDNPFWIVNNNPYFDEVNRMYGNIRLAYDFNQWAVLSTTLGTDFYSDVRRQEFEIGSRTIPAGQVIRDVYDFINYDLYLNLNGSGNLLDDFSLSYNLGANLYGYNEENFYTQGDGLNFSGFRELNNTASKLDVNTLDRQRTASLFGSLDFGYKNFLYLTLTGRNDWISTLIDPSIEFNAGDIDVFYPSASLSFVFSELINSSVLNFGKLRASVAQVGGGAPAAYLTSTTFIVPAQPGFIYSLNDGWTNGIGFPFNGQSGFTYFPRQGSQTLVPSRTTDIEFGLDLRFLNNRIGLDLTYYTRQSKDQILNVPVSRMTGFQRATLNSGELSTEGVEVVLNLSPVQTQDFSWDIGINFSAWETVIESLAEGVQNQYLDGFTGSGIYNFAPDPITGEKFEYGQFFGGAFQRVNDANNTFNPDNPYNPDGALVIDDDPTSANFGYPLVDPTTRILGNPNPDFLLGINNTIRYKDLTLSFLFDIKEGGDMWNGTQGALTFFGMSELTEDRDATLPDGSPDYDNATFVFEGVNASDGSPNTVAAPLDENWYLGNGGGFGSVAEHFVQDASFYRLRLATLSYTFNNNLLQNSPFSDLRLNFTGRNLLLWTPYEGIDPETSLVGSSSNGQGIDYFQMPNTRSYAVGLNVSF
ncbi:MAG: SusC/RagA family TonB-linked outer membrane protein [Bacteroidota bacterium]